MTNEERLRNALEEIIACVSACNSKDDAVDHLVWISDKATEALGATAGGPEMDRLVEWLEEEERKARRELAKWYDGPVPKGVESGYQKVLDHIRELGYGEQGDTLARPRDNRSEMVRFIDWLKTRMAEVQGSQPMEGAVLHGWSLAMSVLAQALAEFGYGEDK